MLGINEFLKRLVLKRGVAQVLGRLKLYLGFFLGDSSERKAYALDMLILNRKACEIVVPGVRVWRTV